MPILIKIASFLAPLLASFLSKNSDKYFGKLADKIEALLGSKTIPTTLVTIKEDGTPVHPLYAQYVAKEFGLVMREFAPDGSLEILGFKEGDEVEVEIFLGSHSEKRLIKIDEFEVKRIIISSPVVE